MLKGVNRVVRVLVTTDFFYNGAFGSFAPVFAIFVTGQIEGGSASVAGFGATVYWVVKSVFQIPIARFLDRTDGERDDFWALFFGYLFSALVPFGYLLAREPWHLYALQGFLGFAMAFAVPAWYAIFTRHLDRLRIGFEWSLWSTLAVGVPYALAAAVGGLLADSLGFRALFVASGTVALIASLLLLRLRSEVLPRDHATPLFPERHPHP